MERVWIAFGLTVLAGMATGIGSILAFATKRTNYRFLAVSTGFSAGVMLYVSFVEIFIKGSDALTTRYGETLGQWINVASFFGGILLIGLIDNLIPEAENPHETHAEEELTPIQAPSASTSSYSVASNQVEEELAPGEHEHELRQGELMRMGLFTALAIGIHNFPEGLATFLAALQDPALGLAIAGAIALHNIPEGVSVSVPIFYATGDRRKAFIYSLLSGLSEPVGAGVAYLVLRLLVGSDTAVVPPEVMGILFGGVAGIMVYISLDELLPTSRAYGEGHDSLFGLVAGMLVMALSLLLMM
jgi:ZIP family zinc transporter